MNSAIELLAKFSSYEEEEEDEDGRFTCRICGRTEYRNGEFETIKLADIFPHVSDFPRRSSTEGRGDFLEKLCGNCAKEKDNGEKIKVTPPKTTVVNNNNHCHPVLHSSLTQQSEPGNNYQHHQQRGLPINVVSVLTLNEGNIPDKSGHKSEFVLPMHDDVAMRNFGSGSDQFILRVGGEGNGMIYNEEKANFHHHHHHQNVIVSQRSALEEKPEFGSIIPSTVSNLESFSSSSEVTSVVKKSPLKKGKKSSPEIAKPVGNSENSCPTCNKTFKSPKIAQRHFKRVHEKQNSYCCEICGAFFSYRGSLDSHLASHNPPEETIDCRVCGQKFKERSNLAAHVKTNHFENTKKFKCEFCPSEFTKRVNLRHHQKRKHAAELELNNNSGDPSKPAQNEKTSSPVKGKGETMSTVVSPSADPKDSGGGFKCEHCGRNFLFKNNLKAHLRTHTRDKKYTCEQCEKSFIYKESLKNHMLLHSNILPYQCDICGKKFRDRSNRRKHVKNVHKYLLINGEATTSIIPTPNLSANNSLQQEKKGKGKKNPGMNAESPGGEFGFPPVPSTPKKKGKKKKGEETQIDPTVSVPKKKTSKAKKPNENQISSTSGQSSVIVSAPNSNLAPSGSDRAKIIMSPTTTKSDPNSLLGEADYGQMYSERNVIVKRPMNLPPPDSDFYAHSMQQNVIVYPKTKEFGQPPGSVISSLEEQQQHQQYYEYHHHHQHQQQQQDMKYLPLTVSNLDVSPESRFEYQQGQNSNSNSNEVLGYGGDEGQYLNSEPNPSVYNTLTPQEDPQYWVSTSYPSAGSQGQSAYEPQQHGQPVQHVQLSNVPYGQHHPSEQDGSGNIYKDLQQFDFSNFL